MNTTFDKNDHIALKCVCCGSDNLKRSPAILMPFISHRIYQWKPVKIDESWGLETIQLGNAYSLCNSLLCAECNLLFLDIRFNSYEMDRLYKNYRDKNYTSLRDYYEPGYKLRNEGLLKGINYLPLIEKFLTPHLPDKLRILDWGGDTGINTPFKSNDNNEIHIYDISGIDTIGKLRKVSLKTASKFDYDLFVCSNVLEHIPFPAEVLSQIKNLMKPRSLLYIEVPLENHVKEFSNPNTLLEKKKHWHEHINFFSESSLRTLISSLQLELISFKIETIWQNDKPFSIFMLACSLKRN